MARESADEVEIIDLIHRNRIAVYTCDFELYQSCFLHADYTTRWHASRQSGIAERQGWDEIAVRAKALFVEHHDPNAEVLAHETKVENLRLHIAGDMAWASFLQVYPVRPAHHLSDMPTHEIRFFERHDGVWKIAFLGYLDPTVADPTQPLVGLDAERRVLWKTQAAEALLPDDDDLVIRNGRLRVRDSRTDQQLQAAVDWAMGLGRSLVSRRGSLPIVLEAGEGLPTRVWWVMADSGTVFIHLGRAGLDPRRLDAAAIVFGLSPAQKALAGHIVDGLSLPEIAEKMSITANTARTHLDRIYEKTGVRTQPALVRVLLSAAPIL